MTGGRALILLDRDGVLNGVVVDEEHGTIDSPLHPSQVEVFPWVPEALAMLQHAGYGLCIVTNQPAAAKGRTTRTNLEAVHAAVLAAATARGARILSSHICFHRREDECACRKPRTGLLTEAFRMHTEFSPARSWMVGDGVTDVEVGRAFGLRTAFLGARKCDACKVLTDRSLVPDYWGDDLLAFARYLADRGADADVRRAVR